MNLSHIIGCFSINAYGAFLNGSEPKNEGLEDVSVPKSFELDGIQHPYISSQCWRKWWKESFHSLYTSIQNKNSIEKKYKEKAFLNPVDDLFGYFSSINNKIELDEITKTNVSQIRSSPLQMTHLQPINRINDESKVFYLSKDKAYIHLDEGTPLPYSSKFYNATLEALFSIDVNRICTYRNFNDRQELAPDTIKKYIKNDLIIQNKKNMYDLKDKAELLSLRIEYLMKSLFFLFGGAKSAQYAVDINPKIFLFAGCKGANNIFAYIIENGLAKPRMNLQLLESRISNNKNIFKTPVFIGIRKGSVEEQVDNIKEIQERLSKNYNIQVVVDSPFECINKFKKVIEIE